MTDSDFKGKPPMQSASPTAGYGNAVNFTAGGIGKSTASPDIDRRTFAASLHKEYLSSVWRFLRARCDNIDDEQISDLTAEVFTAAWKAIGTGKIPEEPWAWLKGIARRKCADFWRAKKRAVPERSWDRLANEEQQSIENHLDGKQNDQPLLTKEGQAVLREALSELPPLAQELLLNRHVKGESIKEMAERINKTQEAVESALLRARKALRAAFTKRRNE